MGLLFLLIFIPVAIVGINLQSKFLNQLRTFHPEIWQSLGSPSFWNNSPHNSFLTMRFLLKADFRSIEDEEFVRFCERFRIFVMAYLIGLGAYFIFALIWIIYLGSQG
jgi:hypothetical protein